MDKQFIIKKYYNSFNYLFRSSKHESDNYIFIKKDSSIEIIKKDKKDSFIWKLFITEKEVGFYTVNKNIMIGFSNLTNDELNDFLNKIMKISIEEMKIIDRSDIQYIKDCKKELFDMIEII